MGFVLVFTMFTAEEKEQKKLLFAKVLGTILRVYRGIAIMLSKDFVLVIIVLWLLPQFAWYFYAAMAAGFIITR